MFRFVLVLLLAGGLWFGYRELTSQASAAVDAGAAAQGGGDPVATDAEFAGFDLGADPPAPEVTREAVAPPPPLRVGAPDPRGAPTDADIAVEALIGGLAGGDPQAASQAFSVMTKLQGPSRERLSQAIDAASKRAGVSASVSLLGSNNAFLHTEQGRQMARAAIQKTDQLSDEQAVTTLSQLMELSMRGPISKSDTEARALVDETWVALRRALRKTVLNPAYMARARSYKVEPGDVLDRIARSFRKLGYKVDAGTIAAFNRIDDPRRLRAGQVIKIPVEPIKTVVEKRSFMAAVYVGDTIFRVYRIGHGTDDRTPEATFTIGEKLRHPAWYAPDGQVWPYGHPQNVLGDYFVKFCHPSFTGFGAHGTSEPESVGTMASAGCLRLADADIEDYFEVIPRGTVVEVRASR